jgi:hypothetical protein
MNDNRGSLVAARLARQGVIEDVPGFSVVDAVGRVHKARGVRRVREE